MWLVKYKAATCGLVTYCLNQYPGFCVRLKFASRATCGIGKSSERPGVNPVANLARLAVLIAVEIHATLVVPAGVAVGAGK